MKKRIIANMWSIVIFNILIALYFSKGANKTEWWVQLIIAVVPAIIAAVVIFIISRRSQINDNTYQVSRLIDRLGLHSDKTLNAEITDKFYSIHSDIGRNENSSLTKQHEEMKKILMKEIELAERRYKKEDDRIRNFTIEQHNMNESIKQFKLFLESWEQMAEDTNNQSIRINKLEKENQALRERNRALTEQIEQLKDDQEQEW